MHLYIIISKVLEKILFDISIKFSLISLAFYLVARSTSQQLLLFINELLEVKKANKMHVMIIYLDFKKAFDSINHNKLLRNIKSFGITGTLF